MLETVYRGYTVFVAEQDFTVCAPDSNETFTSRSMSAIRLWVRRHRKEAARK